MFTHFILHVPLDCTQLNFLSSILFVADEAVASWRCTLDCKT